MIWNYPKYSWKDMRFLLSIWTMPEMRARARLVYSFELWQDITGWDDEMLAQTLGKCRKKGGKKREMLNGWSGLLLIEVMWPGIQEVTQTTHRQMHNVYSVYARIFFTKLKHTYSAQFNFQDENENCVLSILCFEIKTRIFLLISKLETRKGIFKSC